MVRLGLIWKTLLQGAPTGCLAANLRSPGVTGAASTPLTVGRVPTVGLRLRWVGLVYPTVGTASLCSRAYDGLHWSDPPQERLSQARLSVTVCSGKAWLRQALTQQSV